MSRKTITLAASAALAACLFGSAPMASAHHAGANFDMTKHYIYKGTVKKWMWVNPHSWLYVEVTKANGATELWGFEAGGPNMLARDGWKASSLKAGDTVTVQAAPDRHGKRNAMLEKVTLGNGKVFTTGLGAAPPGVAGPSAPAPVEYK